MGLALKTTCETTLPGGLQPPLLGLNLTRLCTTTYSTAQRAGTGTTITPLSSDRPGFNHWALRLLVLDSGSGPVIIDDTTWVGEDPGAGTSCN